MIEKPFTTRPSRRAMTLVEMLVATTMTLIIMGVVAQLFGMMGKGITGNRNALDLDAQLRGVAHTLRTDLAGITVVPIPPVPPESDSGYLEIIEGPGSDLSAFNAGNTTTLTADWDDVLLFTTRSFGEPFTGRCDTAVFGTSTIRSQFAEVAWFCRRSPPAQQLVPGTILYTLYRRQLLVIPYVGLGSFLPGGNSVSATLPVFQNNNDLSVHATIGGVVSPNSLADLTKRENRFRHNPAGTVSGGAFPYDLAGQFDPITQEFNGQLVGAREGEDIVLTNVIAFDVRVFDPQEPLVAGATGEYVDLGSLLPSVPAVPIGNPFPPVTGSIFRTNGVRVRNASTNNTLFRPTYDTWSTHYEANGLDEDGVLGADQGTNLIDDGGIAGIVDDPGERETSPPYPVPLRGIEVRIRCYEPSSRQVRQVTIRHTFVPH
jgi:type II secretory pathway pseudopilin PulG